MSLTVHDKTFMHPRDAGQDALMSASRYVPVTKHDTDDLPGGVCRGLLVSADGTLNLTQPDGTPRDGIPVTKGYNGLMALKVRTGGSEISVWALY